MADIATTLASDFLAGAGWCCILIAPQTTVSKVLRPPATTVTIEGVRDREADGSRIWLKRQHAERVVAALFSRCQQAQRRRGGDGVLISLPVTATASMVRDVADSLGYAPVGDEFVDEQMAMVTKRIEAAMSRMKRDGSMRQINREYTTARASGASLPRFDNWLAARLRPALQAGLC